MTKKITMSVLAIAAITALSFKAPGDKHLATYTVDSKLTSAEWLAKKVTGQHNGKITVTKGTVINDHGIITGGTVEFDMNSISVTDLTEKEWNDKLVGHLKSEDFFSVVKHPTAHFDVTKVIKNAKSDNDFDVTGKLAIKGITHEITFPAKIKMDEKSVVIIAKIMVNRVKYDIKYGSASIFQSIGDKAINDEFELDLNLVAGVK